MKIGYARVSTQDQNLQLQLDALHRAGCELIFQDKKSGKNADRKGLQDLQQKIRKGDTVIVWKLDRLGRSLKDLINLVSSFEKKEVGFVSLQDSIDTTTPTGKLTFHIFAALAEFERSMISERTKAGLAAARARGRVGGRKPGLSKKAQDKARLAESLYKEKVRSIKEICEHLEISKPTLYRYLRSRGVEIGK